MVQNASNYLPHHAVIRKEKSTTNLRIIYDASAKTEGPSLNDCLYAGPSYGQCILDILIRFWLHRIALFADIEKAFLMISIAEDRNALRLIWLDDINSHLPRASSSAVCQSGIWGGFKSFSSQRYSETSH